MRKTYVCIDLKSFYASVECVERGFDPMTTKLVVADPSRSDKTICLAVSPALKKLGVKNRCRVFEIPKNIDYIMAPPRMQKYIDCSAEIYGIYLEYFSKEDIHVYSIDEAFIDVTGYFEIYQLTPRQIAVKIMNEIENRIGIRATCGIGTNMYLCKIALDITAKHSPDFIGELTEETYIEKLSEHKPLTDFWRIGPGIARRLEKVGITTMADIRDADEEFLYTLLGIDAELLIDHAYGIEPVTIADIKAYKPHSRSITSGQVLMRDYEVSEGRIVLREMMEEMCLQLVADNMITESATVMVGYARPYQDNHERGTVRFQGGTNSASTIVKDVLALYDRMMDNTKKIRRFNISCNNVTKDTGERQLSLFDSINLSVDNKSKFGNKNNNKNNKPGNLDKLRDEKKVQKAILEIKNKYGKNAIIKGTSLQEEATGRERNRQIGGHKSGE